MKTIFNKSSLFWKIFLAFWLANFLVIAATTYFTLHARQSNEARQHKEEIVELIGRHSIAQWESNKSLRIPGRLKRHGIRIDDSEGNIIFNNITGAVTKRHAVFNFRSDSNRDYKIYLPHHKPPKFLKRHFKKMLIFRLFLIFIASGIVSYILGRMITAPMKRLGQQTQSVSNGQIDSVIEASLLNRKDEIGELARDFDGSLRNISVLIDSKQTLLHDVSHELRAPLARLMAAIGLLEQTKSKTNDSTASLMLKRIEAECNNMNILIDQILHLSRFESTEPQKSHIDIVTLLGNCIKDTQFEYKHHPISLNSESASVMMNADTNMLTTAFNNILRNGCQHTPVGTTIDIDIQQQGSSVVIHIQDNGDGLPQQDIDNIFKPFSRMHDSGSNFGLGLNITQRVIEKHHGSITAASREGRGLILIITLPNQ